MTITTLTSREFNQDLGRAKRIAADGPVIITDRGTPAFALLSIDAYRRLTGAPRRICDVLAFDAAEIDLPTEKAQIDPRPVDLT